LSGIIKNYLEIRKLVEQFDSPDIRESFTYSSEALQCYFHGYNAAIDMDLQPAVEWFSQAIEIDSGFISSYVLLSITYRGMGKDKLARNCCVKANKNRNVLPLLGKLKLDHLNAYYFETPNEQIRYIKQILEIDEMNSFYWFMFGSVYYNQDQYENAVIYYEKVLDIHKKWGTLYRFPFLYFRLGNSYHQLNNHKREKEVYEIGLTALPDYPTIISYQATCALSRGDQKKGDNLITQYKSIRKNNSLWPESRILSEIGTIYSRAELFDEAEIFYRQALKLDPQDPEEMNILAWYLIDYDIDVYEGVDLVEKALELDPENSNYLDTKGWGLYKQGRYEEALQDLNDSWDLKSAYEHVIYQHIQEVKKALANQNN
jgi:tetratricopeptide (TPR) repeat protein